MALLAFYGTLLAGLPPRPGRPALEPHVRLVGPCVLPGQLWDVGPYPALTSGDGFVRGELWETISPEALSVLDGWEEYYPGDEAGSRYLRRRVRLLEPVGVSAWTYLWNRSVTELSRIESGDWRLHLSQRSKTY